MRSSSVSAGVHPRLEFSQEAREKRACVCSAVKTEAQEVKPPEFSPGRPRHRNTFSVAHALSTWWAPWAQSGWGKSVESPQWELVSGPPLQQHERGRNPINSLISVRQPLTTSNAPPAQMDGLCRFVWCEGRPSSRAGCLGSDSCPLANWREDIVVNSLQRWLHPSRTCHSPHQCVICVLPP